MTRDADQAENEDTQTDDTENPDHVVDLGDTEETDSDDGGEEGERQQTRDEKKRARQRLREELAERDRTISELREKHSGLERTVSELRQTMQQTRQDMTEARRDDNDPLEAELNQVLDQQQELADLITSKGGKMSAEEEKRFSARARQLRIREQEIVAERVSKRNAPQRDPFEGVRTAVKGAYPEVFGNPKALARAKGHMLLMIADRGEPRNEAELHKLMRDACEEAKKDLGMSRPAPTDADRARTTGTPRGGTGGGSRDLTVHMGDFEKMLANKAFKHIKDDKQRYSQWAKTAGRKMLERKAKAGATRKK